MAFLEKFAYKRKKVLVVNGTSREENLQSKSWGARNQSTPNKAHSPNVTCVPETPHSLLPTPPSLEIGQKRLQNRQRRRARISSSSEEDGICPSSDPPPLPPPTMLKSSCSLFAELPVSKRRKKDSNGFHADALKPEECEPGLQRKKNLSGGFHSNPRRLFCSSDSDEKNGRLSPSPSLSSLTSRCHEGGKCEPATAASRGKLKNGRCGRKEVVDSESEEEDCRTAATDDLEGHDPKRVSKKMKHVLLDSDEEGMVTKPRGRGKNRVITDSEEDGETEAKCRRHGQKKAVIHLSSDSEKEGEEKMDSARSRAKKPILSSHSNGGWLTTRGSVAKLQQFSFKKKEGRKERQNGASKSKPISVSSSSSSSQAESSMSSSSQDMQPSQEVSQEVSQETLQEVGVADVSCCIIDPPTAESEAKNAESASHVGRFYGKSKSRSVSAPHSTGVRTRRSKGRVRNLEEMDRALGSGQSSDSEESSMEEGEEEDYSASKKEAVLKFLNGCNQEEMCDIPSCSLVKAKLLSQLRPFRDWSHLLEVLSKTKRLSDQIIEGCLCLLKERKVLEDLLSKCKALSGRLQGCLSKLTASSSAEPPTSSTATPENSAPGLQCMNQPDILTPSVQLKPYQLVGLNWLAMLHSQDVNGILADEMGLGKTVQAIAFLAHLFQTGLSGIYLVIVPTSTIDNWAREFEKWCPTLSVQIYHGSLSDRFRIRETILSDDECDVILSTYQMCIGQLEDRKFFRQLCIGCVVFDEAHMLKNIVTRRYAHLMKIKTKRRLLLTGTPLQNNLLELMSLLSFVMPEMFKDFSPRLRKTFSRKLDETSSYYKEQVKQAKQIMQPFILRRLKSQVLKQLPAKVEQTEWCKMTESQGQLYALTVERSQKELPKQIGPSDDMSKSLSVITELRKIAMHPLLLRQHYNNSQLHQMSRAILQDPAHCNADPALVYEDMSVMSDFELHNLCLESKPLSECVLSRECLEDSAKFQYLKPKLQELKAKGSRVLLFSQFTMMLDVLEVFLKLCGHAYLRMDGSTVLTERQKLIDRYNSDQNIFIFLLSTKAGGLGVNLTSANVVILYDIDFNPYNDKQAQDRCHRVGQTREVTVLRLICPGTIEEAILRCGETKLKLEKDLSHSNADGPSSTDVAALLEHGLGLTKETP